MIKNKIFILMALGFAVGIFLGSSLEIANNNILIVMAFCIAALVFGIKLGVKFVTFMALFLVCACLGVIRLNQTKVPNQFGEILGQKMELTGNIVEDPDIRTDKQLITFQSPDFSQRILITAPLSQSFFYGDELLIYGKLSEAKSSGEFDYKIYLERYNVYALMSYPKMLIIRSHGGSTIMDVLLRVKYAFTARLSKLFVEPQNSLLLGILIGAKKTLPQSIIDNFNNTGTSHVIAVSGYNISIMAGSLGFLVYIFGRKKYFWVALIIITSFVIMAGASASVVRAAIMGGLFLVSRFLGRQYYIPGSLFLAGLVMLIINPRILSADVGFELSFSATAGIIYFMPHLEKLTGTWDNLFNIKTIFLITMSAIVSTLPLLVYNFGTLSLLTPLVNMLVLPLVPLTMLVGFLSILPVIGTGCAFVANILLVYILNITKIFAHIPYASVPMEVPFWFFGVMIGCIGLLYFIIRYCAGKVEEIEYDIAVSLRGNKSI